VDAVVVVAVAVVVFEVYLLFSSLLSRVEKKKLVQ
jgi:hypothetical protein